MRGEWVFPKVKIAMWGDPFQAGDVVYLADRRTSE